MAIFCFMGDCSHFLAAIILLFKIWWTKTCVGVSGKTQFLYAIALTARYFNIATIMEYSMFMFIGKLIFICIAYMTVITLFLCQRTTYDRDNDKFRIDLLILPALVLTILYPGPTLIKDANIKEYISIFGALLEGVAIVPQTFFATKSKKIHSVVAFYIGFLGLSAILQITHWISVYYSQNQLGNVYLASDIIRLIFCFDYFIKNMLCLRSSRVCSISDKETGEVILATK